MDAMAAIVALWFLHISVIYNMIFFCFGYYEVWAEEEEEGEEEEEEGGREGRRRGLLLWRAYF